MSVFRVWRDDAYLTAMLRVLGALLTQHVARGAPPAGAAFASAPGQAALLSRTCEIARCAEAVAAPGDADSPALAPPACADGSNTAAFWS